MPRSNRKLQLAFGYAILSLLLVAVVSYRGMILSSEGDHWSDRSRVILRAIRDVVVAEGAVESSSNAYALTGDPSYLDAYRAGVIEMTQDERILNDVLSRDSGFQQDLSALNPILKEKARRHEGIINARTANGIQGALQAVDVTTDLRLTDRFDKITATLRAQELAAIDRHDAVIGGSLKRTKLFLIFETLSGLFIALLAAWNAKRNATARGLAEHNLRSSEEKYKILLNGVHDHSIILLDPEGFVISWNVGAERTRGFTAEEIIGQHFSRFFLPESVASGRPAEVLRQAAANGRFETHATSVRKDGSQFLAEITITALRDENGNLQGFSEISQDVSINRESEARYRGLLEAAPDAMVVVNSIGEIVLLNVQAEQQFGYRRDELLGQKVINIIPEGFAERLIADGTRTAAEALAQQIGMGIELFGRRKDGSGFPIEMMLSPLESSEGILVTAAIRNISVRKTAEMQLEQTEAKYRGLLEAAPDAMVVVDGHGDIVLLNVQAEKQFGYRRDELVGQEVTNIIPEGFAERLIADGSRTATEALAQQIGMGIELFGKRKDASSFPIEIMLSPLFSSEGVLITAAIRNISVRKRAEEHLAQMEARYRGLLEAAPDAMVVVNQQGEIVLLNVQAEKQFGYLRDELLGQKVTNIIPEGFAERLVADALRSAEDALAQQIGMGIELYGRRRDQSIFPIEIMLSPLTSVEGVLVTAAIRDISVRQRAEANLLQKVEELKRSNEELGQFAYIASHDLQEPLRMVASYTQLLSRRYKGRLDADADDFIAFAVDGANRMQRLIQDLLAYSRVETKGKVLAGISSSEALAQALLNLRGAIQESGAVITHDDLPAVLADETQLVQLFQNLLANAIKYQGAGIPRAHISVSETEKSKWTFSVADNGIGIEPQYFDRIFGMFQRLHKRAEFDGTGIGLAICKKIVERHGGAISVESIYGQGSTFHFALAGADKVSLPLPEISSCH